MNQGHKWLFVYGNLSLSEIHMLLTDNQLLHMDLGSYRTELLFMMVFGEH